MSALPPFMQGLDANNIVRPVLVNTNGNAIVVGTNSDKLLSISDRLLLTKIITPLAAGTNSVLMVTVPAGFIYHLTNSSMNYNGTITTVIYYLIVIAGGTQYNLLANKPVTNNIFVSDVLNIWLTAGDLLYFQVLNATAGNTAQCDVNGHSMHIT